MTCPHCNDKYGTRASLPFTVYCDRFLKLLLVKYRWSVIKAYWFDTTELVDAYKKGMTVEEAYWDYYNIERDDMHPDLITPENSVKKSCDCKKKL